MEKNSPNTSGTGGRRMHVMMLGLRALYGAQGGIETHVSNLSEELAKRGCSITVVERLGYGSTSPSHSKVAERVSLWTPRSQSLETIIHTLIGVAYAVIRRPEILHLHGIGPGLVAPLARLGGLRVVVTHHGEDYQREKWGPIAKLALRLGELASKKASIGLICVSAITCARLSASRQDRLVHIPNGVPPRDAIDVDRSIIAELGLEGAPFILTVGRQVPEKRQLDLILAFKQVSAAHDEWRLVLVGGADHPSAYSRQIEAEALNHPHIILARRRPHDQVKALYEAAAMFVLPSSHEGLPIVMLEAMSYNKLVILSDIPANQNLKLPDECYFPVGDVNTLATRIEASMEQYHKGALPDWTYLLQSYDWGSIAEQTLALYASVRSR